VSSRPPSSTAFRCMAIARSAIAVPLRPRRPGPLGRRGGRGPRERRRYEKPPEATNAGSLSHSLMAWRMSAAAPAEFSGSCPQKLLFGSQWGKLDRLPRGLRKVVISSRGMAFFVARGTWGWGFRQSNQ
jgi:hypothetical protein